MKKVGIIEMEILNSVFGLTGFQHSFNWDASAHPAGMYFFKLHNTDGQQYSGKIILQK